MATRKPTKKVIKKGAKPKKSDDGLEMVNIRVPKPIAEQLRMIDFIHGNMVVTNIEFNRKDQLDVNQGINRGSPMPFIDAFMEQIGKTNQTMKEVPFITDDIDPPKSVLEQAVEIIHGDREKTYGRPDVNLQTIAQLWQVYLDRKHTVQGGTQITAQDVCQMMILLKMGRLLNDPNHKDSLIDQAGYVGLSDRIGHV